MAPPTLLGSIAEALLGSSGADATAAGAVSFMQSVGALIAVGVVAWLFLRVAPAHPIGAATGAFAVFVVCGPVLQPWYVLPVFALLGACRADRRWVQLAVWVTIVLVGYSAFDVALASGAAVLGVVIVGYALYRLWRSRTDLVDAPLGAPGVPAAPAAMR